MAQAERKVLFFKLRVRDEDIEDQDRSFEETCRKIMQLPAEKRQYDLAGPEEYIKLMSFGKLSESADCYKGHFVKYRSGNLVTGRDDTDNAEDYTLADGRKPLEITHFLYIPKYHMLAVEYNHHGPKYSQFVSYINALQLTAQMEHIYYVADTLFHPDTLSILQQAKEIKMLELSMSRANVVTGSGYEFIKNSLKALVNIGRPGKLTVTLSADRGQSMMTGQELVNGYLSSSGQLREYESAKVAVVMENGMETQLINLLQDKIDSTIKIPQDKIIAESQQIFDELWKVYSQNKPLLLKALDEKTD